MQELLAAKAQSGKTFKAIAQECGWTNAFTAQLFHGQAQLPKGRAEALRAAVPALGEAHLEALSRPPMRTFDPAILQEPLVYRLYEVSLGWHLLQSLGLAWECPPSHGRPAWRNPAGDPRRRRWRVGGAVALFSADYLPLTTCLAALRCVPQAVGHYGEGLKAIVNEEFGDGETQFAVSLLE